MNRYDMFPHIEERMTMTVREWLLFHWTMHRHNNFYRGKHFLKTPMDIMVLGDIISETRPEVIIEIGAFDGGSALWMADRMEQEGIDGRVIGIDINDRCTAVEHPRISWIIGDCVDPSIVDKVQEQVGEKRAMVVEDSDHKLDTTRKIMDLYWRFVAKGCYFLVEDTIVEFIDMPPFPGPLKAVKEFIDKQEGKFVIDRSRERYIITHNPMGYLLRVE